MNNLRLSSPGNANQPMPTDNSTPPVPLALHLLGPFAARVHGTPLPRLRSRKGQWLLALLALREGREVERSWLMELLWPNAATPQAAMSLRATLRDLRQALGPEAGLLYSPTHRGLALDLTGATVDVHTFDQALGRGDEASLAQAVSLYGGPLLEGCAEEWIFPERQTREERLLAALETLAARAMERDDPATAQEYLRRAVAVDPLRESAQRALMRALDAGGNAAAALLTYRELRLHLHRELNAEPDPETTALFQQLRAEARSATASTLSVLSSTRSRRPSPGRARPSNLPAPTTPLLGREQELGEVCTLLRQPEVRLVTLTGPGGVGKTRLALQAASELQDAFADGVVSVPLAALCDPALIPSAITQALDLRESGSQSARAVLEEHLRDREILLLLDNFEHLLTAALLPAELLAAAPRLKLLVTSRTLLRLRGEHEFPVLPLALPDPKRQLPLAALSQVASVALFLQRAREARLEFGLSEENAPVLSEICRRLDGLPLAIELAAARIKLLSPQALLARLSDRLGLLVDGARDLPGRQQTLRDTIAWSYDLLSEGEKRLFHRLAVFVGGFTLEAAEAVCQPEDLSSAEYPPPEIDVLEGIAALAEKSLLRQEEPRDGEPRFSMLETVREYALECLGAGGEALRAKHRHLNYYLALAQRSDLNGPEQGAWLERMEREHDNFRAALDAALRSEKEDAGPKLAAALAPFWENCGHLGEGLHWLTRALAHPQAAEPTTARSALLNAAGNISAWLGDPRAARALHEENLKIKRAVGNRTGTAVTLHNLAMILNVLGEYAQARAMFEEALATERQQGNRRGEACTLLWFGMFLVGQGENDAAQTLLQEAVAMNRERGDTRQTAVALQGLGVVASRSGDNVTAQAQLEEALALSRSLGTRGYEAGNLNTMGIVALQSHDYVTARMLFAQALEIYQEIGQRGGVAASLELFARLAVLEGQSERAARLVGAAEGLRAATGIRLAPAGHAELESSVAAARIALGEHAFGHSWEQGRAIPLEQAIRFALQSDVPTLTEGE